MRSLRKTISLEYVLWLHIALALLTVAGCAIVGPDYVRPEIAVSRDWHSPLRVGLTSKEAGRGGSSAWWTMLNDSRLSSLIDRALAGNLDLKKAQTRVREARARKRMAKGGLFPTLDFTGSATRDWASGNNMSGGNPAISSVATGGSPLTGGTSLTSGTSSLYNAGFDASWEVDIFGGLRRSLEAAEGDLQASEEDLRDVLVSLVAEVATNYVEVRSYQARLDVAQKNLGTQSETYRLTVWQCEAGLSDELSVRQARYNLESTRSRIPDLTTGLEGAMNRIAVLLGERPGTIHGELKTPMPVPVTPLQVAIGIPADMLRRRPDVRRAERQLAAQTARVGVATADLYPKLTLSGSIGLEALSASELLSSPIRTAGGGPQITWPIFHGGVLRHTIEVQSALQEQYLIAYEAAVLGATEEVENALVAYAEEHAKRDSLRVAEEAARKAAELAEHKYEAGLVDFVNVLDTQRSLLSFQDQLAQSNGAATIDLIRLYKALGGGWESLLPSENSVSANGGTK